MGLLQKLLKGNSEDKIEFKQKLKAAQQDKRIQDLIEERSKSSNERDLINRMKKKREDGIKMELDKLRKEDSKEMWKSKNNILKSQTNILKNDRPILKEKNIFIDHRNDIPFVQRGMFFRW